MRCQLPSHKHFTEVAVPALVNDVKSGIEEKIKAKQLDYYSATTDLWTSSVEDPYMTFAIHFIDTDWDLVSHCLQIHYLSHDHAGTNIAEALEESIQQWELEPEKLVGITTDIGLCIKLACDLLNWTRLVTT